VPALTDAAGAALLDSDGCAITDGAPGALLTDDAITDDAGEALTDSYGAYIFGCPDPALATEAGETIEGDP